ncbi:MAG TPA: archease [Thermogutta sp.]|nr:archease [Thermogutta sp.]
MGLKARLKVRAYDPVRDGGEVEIKAVTYHGLRIEKEANEFTAQVIFDV